MGGYLLRGVPPPLSDSRVFLHRLVSDQLLPFTLQFLDLTGYTTQTYFFSVHKGSSVMSCLFIRSHMFNAHFFLNSDENVSPADDALGYHV